MHSRRLGLGRNTSIHQTIYNAAVRLSDPKGPKEEAMEELATLVNVQQTDPKMT